MAEEKKVKSVAEVLTVRQKELLESWLEKIRALAGTRTLELMTEEQLQTQATELLRALTTAFGAEQYVRYRATRVRRLRGHTARHQRHPRRAGV